jgi:tRNA threonylcarbamoyladenosine biosynthesis protein TsaB
MPYILLIETSTKACSVALARGEKVLANELVLPDEYVHAEKLNLLIIKLLKTAGLDIRALNAVAFSCGPGSYTGLRIGLSTAKALCYVLNIPLIYVDTLKTMALKAKKKLTGMEKDSLLCPMIDARRMEVYTALFDFELRVIKDTAAVIIDDVFLSNYQSHRIYFFGDGAAKCRDILENHQVKYLPDIWPDASFMASDAYANFLHGHKQNIAYCEPLYLKGFNGMSK